MTTMHGCSYACDRRWVVVCGGWNDGGVEIWWGSFQETNMSLWTATMRRGIGTDDCDCCCCCGGGFVLCGPRG